MNDSTISTTDLFRQTCKDLAKQINKQLFEDCRDWFWVGEEVGGLCCFEDCDYINVTDMCLIIDNDLSYEQYAEWRDANINYNATRQPQDNRHINLRSWLMGCRFEIFNDK